jgi:hypothetical protein
MAINAAEFKRKLKLTYSGGVVEHLSSQLYSGPVPAVVELIANAWDACASSVEIKLPLDEPIDHQSRIVVRDNGLGMSIDECDDKYLVMGRRKRDHESQVVCRDRKVMGRKGIGKLAVFGIGRRLIVRSIKDQIVTEFVLDYEDITTGRGYVGGEYPIVPAYHGPALSGEVDGTQVTIEQLTLRRRIPGLQFKRSLARRFSILSHDFVISVNGEKVQRKDVETQFRFPNVGWSSEEVDGKKISWWAGFTEGTIKDEDARGFVVMARGKLVQNPWFFDLSGGAYGQHGMQYMVGEVRADFLDEEYDLISTNRQSVAWDHYIASPLREWGERKVKSLLGDWVELRKEHNVQRLRASDRFLPRVKRFSEPRRTELLQAIDKVASVPQLDGQRLEEIVEFLITAYQSEYFYDAIRSIHGALSGNAPFADLVRVLKEWDVLEAIATAQVIRGHIEVIRVFEKMIKEKAPEKSPTRADMQFYVEKYPWLLDMAYAPLEREPRLQRLLEEEYDVQPDSEDPDLARYPDFVVLAYGFEVVVLELKRPGRSANRDHYRQLEDYVHSLRRHIERTTDPNLGQRVTGYLICSGLTTEARQLADTGAGNRIYVVDWNRLITRAYQLHREFFKVMTQRAPADDPAVEQLKRIDDELQEDT